MLANILLIVATCCMLLAVKKPQIMLFLYFFFRPLFGVYAYDQTVFLGVIPITSFLPLIIIGYSFSICIIRRDYKIIPPSALALYCFVFFSSLSFYNSMSIANSFSALTKFLTGLATYILTYNTIKTKKDSSILLLHITITSIVPIIYGFIQYIFFPNTQTNFNRMGSFFLMPNAYGEYLSLMFVATFALLLCTSRKKYKIFIIIIMISILISSILARNRGSWVGLSIAIILSCFFFIKDRRTKWVLFGVCFVVLISLPIIASRFAELSETNEYGISKNTFDGRLGMTEAIITQLVPMKPLIGFGIGTAHLVLGKYIGLREQPHNDYVRIVLETGVPGLILYFVFLGFSFFYAFYFSMRNNDFRINFPFLMTLLYWSIISAAQNIITDVVNFPLFMALVACFIRTNELTISNRRVSR